MRPGSVAFLTNAAVASSLVFVPIFARSVGATPDQIGLIYAAHSALALLASFVFGRLADVRGRRRVLQAGLVLSGAAAVFQAFAHDPVTIAATRALLGLTLGVFPAALVALAYESREPMGRFAALGSAGWALGNMAAGVLGFLYPDRFALVFAGSSTLFFLAALLAFRLPAGSEALVPVPRIPVAVIRRNVAVCATMLIRHTGANMVWVIFPLYLLDLRFSYWEIGLVTGVNPLVQAIVSARLDGQRSGLLVSLGVGLSALVFVLFTVATSVIAMIAVHAVLGAAWATLWVGCLKFVTERNEERATAAGLLASTTALASIVGPIAGGLIAAAWGNVYAMYAAAAMCAVSLVAWWWSYEAPVPAATPA